MSLKDDIVLVVAFLLVVLGLTGIPLLAYVSLCFVEQTCGMDVALAIGLSVSALFPYVYSICQRKK